METVIIDGEEENMSSNKPLIAVTILCVILALGGAGFGLLQMDAKNKQETRIANLEQAVNNHVAEVEALKKQLTDNGITPVVTTTTTTESATNTNSNSNSSSSNATKEEKKETKDATKDTAGDGYAGYFMELDNWEVKFEFPSGVKHLDFIPTDTAITITGLTTAAKEYDSTTCATGFGTVAKDGSAGEKITTVNGHTYYYVAPTGSCKGADFDTAVSLTKKLFVSATKK